MSPSKSSYLPPKVLTFIHTTLKAFLQIYLTPSQYDQQEKIAHPLEAVLKFSFRAQSFPNEPLQLLGHDGISLFYSTARTSDQGGEEKRDIHSGGH